MKKFLIGIGICVVIIFTMPYQARSATEVLSVPKKITKEAPPIISAQSSVVMDAKTKKIIFEKNKTAEWRPASITKLMTSMIFLDSGPKFSSIVAYKKKFNSIGGVLRVRDGETMTIKDLFYCTLVGSANNTANALPSAIRKSNKDFIKLMNSRAKELGMNNTTFVDFSGLSENNYSNANDLAILTLEASKYEKIINASNKEAYEFFTKNSKKYHRIVNTNALLKKSKYAFIISKTGFIYESLYNNVAKLKDKNNNEIIIVTLGSSSSKKRFDDTEMLAKYIYDNFSWKK